MFLLENMEGACLCKTYHLETKVLLEIQIVMIFLLLYVFWVIVSMLIWLLGCSW